MEKNCSIKFALFLTVMWELKRKLLHFSLFEWNRLKAPIERRPAGRFIGIITPQGMEYGVSSWYYAIAKVSSIEWYKDYIANSIKGQAVAKKSRLVPIPKNYLKFFGCTKFIWLLWSILKLLRFFCSLNIKRVWFLVWWCAEPGHERFGATKSTGCITSRMEGEVIWPYPFWAIQPKTENCYVVGSNSSHGAAEGKAKKHKNYLDGFQTVNHPVEIAMTCFHFICRCKIGSQFCWVLRKNQTKQNA